MLPNWIKSSSDEEALNNWYHNHLKERGQLLAIGLSLFDGLFDDQFFAALEEAVNKVWQNRDSNLKALDYCDLDILRGYFDFIDTDDQRTLVKIRYPKQRLTCLKIAWKSHRRQILLVLPVLVEIVKTTTQNSNGELYSSPVRREKLRQSVSEAISGIGLISRLGSREAVEENLLILAASPEIEVQAVAAQSIASWRDQENKGFVLGDKANLDVDEELFSILEGWQTRTEINRFVALLLGEKAKEGSNQAADYIRATLAITIGYASLYDASGDLSEKLFHLFQDLSKDKNKLVRDRFKRYPLPIFIGRHLETIRGFLRSMVKDVDLLPPIAESLALTYRTRSGEVLSLIEEWKAACKKEYKKVSVRNRLGQRESLLATIALTYGHIFRAKGQVVEEDGITATYAFFDLVEILKFEKHQLLRQVLVESIGDLLESNFEDLVEHIDRAIEFIAYGKETKIFEESFSAVYHKQRSQLEGGDEIMSTKKVSYPIWLEPSERKTTLIEKTFLEWIKDDKKKRLQTISAQCLMSFVKDFEKEENKAITTLKAKSDAVNTPIVSKPINEISSSPIIPPEPEENTFLEQFIPWLATRKDDTYRQSVSHILPKVASQSDLLSSGANFLTKKLDQTRDDQLVNLSRFLKRGLWLSKYFVISTVSLAVLILISGLWIRDQVREASRRTPSSLNSSSEAEGEDIQSVELDDFAPLNPFHQEQFPKSSCGDPLPADPSLYPVQYYPVFINFNDENLNRMKAQFCQDAFRKIREESNAESIQVASFISQEQAILFQEFLVDNGFEFVDVGKPSVRETPSSGSSPLPLEKRGAIQFPQGAISTQMEGRIDYPSIHQFTFIASQGQPSSLLIESSSGQMPLNFSAPSGETLVNYRDGLTSWSGTLPESGTYIVSIVGFQAPSSYRLSLVVEP